MPNAPFDLQYHSCGRKRAFRSRKVASDHAKGVRQAVSGTRMLPYSCRFCGFWHLCTDKSSKEEERPEGIFKRPISAKAPRKGGKSPNARWWETELQGDDDER